jgi:hypothetical protein
MNLNWEFSNSETKKNGQKFFSIHFRLIEIERELFAPKLKIISSFFWPKHFGRSAEISALKPKTNDLRHLKKTQNSGSDL